MKGSSIQKGDICKSFFLLFFQIMKPWANVWVRCFLCICLIVQKEAISFSKKYTKYGFNGTLMIFLQVAEVRLLNYLQELSKQRSLNLRAAVRAQLCLWKKPGSNNICDSCDCLWAKLRQLWKQAGPTAGLPCLTVAIALELNYSQVR